MTTEMRRGYDGKARILDRNGMMLDVGKAELTETDAGSGAWSGTLRVFAGSCLQAKSLTVLVELSDGSRTLAQVGPKAADAGDDLVLVKVVGIDPVPF